MKVIRFWMKNLKKQAGNTTNTDAGTAKPALA